MAFKDLPAELLINIFLNLDYKPLKNLERVNRTCRNIILTTPEFEIPTFRQSLQPDSTLREFITCDLHPALSNIVYLANNGDLMHLRQHTTAFIRLRTSAVFEWDQHEDVLGMGVVRELASMPALKSFTMTDFVQNRWMVTVIQNAGGVTVGDVLDAVAKIVEGTNVQPSTSGAAEEAAGGSGT